jgi:hypothetical protein
MSLEEALAKDLPGVLAVTLGIGAGIIIPVTYFLTTNWRKVRVMEQNAVLKKAMIDKGMSADEITAVVGAGTGDDVWENENAVATIQKMIKNGYSADEIAKVVKDGPGAAAKIKG